MSRSSVLWVLAILITVSSAVYQRMTGPTYPIFVRQDFGGSPVHADLQRAHAGAGDQPVEVLAVDPAVVGALRWKRFKTADAWQVVPMVRADKALTADLPHQPPAGKVQYQVILRKGPQEMLLPVEGPLVLRFRGDVPAAILITHILAMFGGMLLATRTGLSALAEQVRMRQLTVWTLMFLITGGLVLGPIVQKYAFDALWTGWPFGHDLTDNKTVVAVLIWVAAWFCLGRARAPRWWIIAAAVGTLVVFMIPHSMFGSELDYTKMPRQ